MCTVYLWCHVLEEFKNDAAGGLAADRDVEEDKRVLQIPPRVLNHVRTLSVNLKKAQGFYSSEAGSKVASWPGFSDVPVEAS